MTEAGVFRLERTVAFGDCDPAGIVYTARFLDHCLGAIEAFWKSILDGRSWYEMNVDLDRGTPFVNVSLDFASPVTPRQALDLAVRVERVGATSVTFAVSGRQGAKECFRGKLTCVVVQKRPMRKVASDDWILERVRAFAAGRYGQPAGAGPEDASRAP